MMMMVIMIVNVPISPFDVPGTVVKTLYALPR